MPRRLKELQRTIEQAKSLLTEPATETRSMTVSESLVVQTLLHAAQVVLEDFGWPLHAREEGYVIRSERGERLWRSRST